MSWWRIAARRARDAPAVPAALAALLAAVAVLLAVVAAGGGAVLSSAVRTTLAAAAPAQRGIEVSVRRDPAAPAEQDRLVRAHLAAALPGATTAVRVSLRGELLPVHAGSLSGPDAAGARLVPLVDADLPGRARLTAGRWPAAGAGTGASVREVTLQADAATRIGVAVGGLLRLDPTDSSSPAPPPLRVVGLWRPSDPDDAFWLGDPLELGGAERAGVLGPLVFDGADRDAVPVRWTVRWRAVPDPATVAPDAVPAVAAGLAGLSAALADVPAAGGAPAETTGGGLAALLAAQVEPVHQVRASAVVLLAVLALLALALCLLAAALLAELRAPETALLRVRGAGRAARTGLGVREALAAGLAGAAVAAPVAAVAVGWAGGTAADDIRAAAVAIGLALLAGAATAVTTDVLARRPARGAGQSALPAALLGLAAAGLAGWQLWQARGSGAAGSAGSGSGVDTVVVIAAPVVLAATAGLGVAVLAQLVRPAGALARGPRVVAALVGWHAARRAARPPAPLAVLVAAVAAAACLLAAMATATAALAARSDTLQAADLVAAVAVEPGAPADAGAVASAATDVALRRVPGVSAITPVTELDDATAGGRPATVLAVDASSVSAVTAGAGAAAVPAGVAQHLAGSAPSGLALPDVARRSVASSPVTLTATGRITLDVPDPNASFGSLPSEVSAVVARDGGAPVRVLWGNVDPGGSVQQLSAVLPPGAGTLIEVDVTLPAVPAVVTRQTLDLTAVAIRSAAGVGTPVQVTGATGAAGWQVASAAAPANTSQPTVTVATAPSSLSVTARYSDRSLPTATIPVRLQPAGGADVPPGTTIPVAVPQAFATALGLVVGDPLALTTAAGDAYPLRVVDVLPRTPAAAGSGTGPSGPSAGSAPAAGSAALARAAPPVLLVDAAALAAVDLAAGRPLRVPHQWWVSGRPATADVLGALAAAAGTSTPTLTTRSAVRAALTDDPLSSGLRRLHAIAAVGAVGTGLLGLALGEVVAARRRRGELAVLQAVGVSRGQVRRLLAAEQVAVSGAAVLGGVGLGVLLAPLLVPFLGPRGGAGDPVTGSVGVVLPWLQLGLLAVGLLAVVAVGALLRGRLAARLDVPAVLRGEVR